MPYSKDRLMLLGAFTPRKRPAKVLGSDPKPFPLDTPTSFSLPNKRELGIKLFANQGKVIFLQPGEATKLWVNNSVTLGPIPEEGILVPENANVQQWDYVMGEEEAFIDLLNEYPRELSFSVDFSEVKESDYPLMVRGFSFEDATTLDENRIPVEGFTKPLMFTVDKVTPLEIISQELAESGEVKIFGEWIPLIVQAQQFNQFKLGIHLTGSDGGEDIITFLYNFTQGVVREMYSIRSSLFYRDTYEAVGALPALAELATQNSVSAFFSTYEIGRNFPLLPTQMVITSNEFVEYPLQPAPPSDIWKILDITKTGRQDIYSTSAAIVPNSWYPSIGTLYNAIATVNDGAQIATQSYVEVTNEIQIPEGGGTNYRTLTASTATTISAAVNTIRYVPGTGFLAVLPVTPPVIIDTTLFAKESKAVYSFNMGQVRRQGRTDFPDPNTPIDVTADVFTLSVEDEDTRTIAANRSYAEITSQNHPEDPLNPAWGMPAAIPIGQVIEFELKLSPAEWAEVDRMNYERSQRTGQSYVSIDDLDAYSRTAAGAYLLSTQVSTTFRAYSGSLNVLENPEQWAGSEFIALPAGVTGTISIQSERTTFEQIKGGADVVMGVTSTVGGLISAAKLTGAVLTYGLSAVGVVPFLVGAGLAALRISKGIDKATGGYDTITSSPPPVIYTLRDPKSLDKLYKDHPEYKPRVP